MQSSHQSLMLRDSTHNSNQAGWLGESKPSSNVPVNSRTQFWVLEDTGWTLLASCIALYTICLGHSPQLGSALQRSEP